MKALLNIAVSAPEALLLSDIERPRPLANQLLVEIKAVGINFPDVLIIEDRYQFRPPRPFAPGGEISGVVREIGSAVSDFAEGDHVMAFCGWGGMAEFIAVDAIRCTRVAASVPFVKAAATLFTYGTALYALQNRGRLARSETLLVLGAAGGVGLSAIDIGRALGAKVIAAASSEQKLAVALKRGASGGVIYPRDPLDTAAQKALGDSLKKACGGAADVVCDIVGGDYSEPAARSLAWGGRFLVVGFAAGVAKLPMNLPLLKSFDIVGVFWGEWMNRAPAEFQAAGARLAGMLEAGEIDPYVSQTLPLAEGGAAIRALKERTSVGKIVLTV